MGIDWSAVLYDPIYAGLGEDATLTPVSADAVSLVVLDKTGPVTVALEDRDNVQVRSLEPRCIVRMSEITAAGLTRRDVAGANITFNDKTYRIETTQPLPSPGGEASGELECFLIELDISDE